MGLTKIIFSLIIFCSAVLPSAAAIDAKISKNHFYDTASTIMSEFEQEKSSTTQEFWSRNVFHFNKYRPFFMLSNKELYNLIPQDKVISSKRFTTPSVYNISLKTSSITKVSLNPPLAQSHIITPKKVVKPVSQNSKLITQYEKAKSQNLDMEEKLDVALLLKDSKNPSNYVLAFDLLNEVITKEPLNAYAYYLKAELYIAKNDSNNAIKNYAEALRINPTSKQCCLGLAKVLEPTNKPLALKYYALANE